MQITKITASQDIPTKEKHQYTQEELQNEYNYFLAQGMVKKLFNRGLISLDEFNKITEKNRQSFSPFLAGIMQKMT